MLHSKWLRLALCVFMLPLTLIVALPGVATAVPSELLSFSLDGDKFGDSASCQLGVGSAAGQVIVGSGGWCQTGSPPSPFCDPGEVDCTTVTVAVKDGFGGTCGSSGLEVISASGWFTTTSTLGAASIAIGDCDPVEICVTMVFDVVTFDSTITGCTLTALDAVEDASEECIGTTEGLTAPAPGGPRVGNAAAGESARRVYMRLDATLPVSDISRTWTVYIATTGARSGAGSVESGYRINYYNILVPAGVTEPFTSGWYDVSGLEASEAAAAATAAGIDVVGVGIFAREAVPGDANTTAWSHIRNPATYPLGRGGITDPAFCGYYWGEKIATDTLTDKDEPVGPIPTPEPPSEDPPPVPEPDPDPEPVDEPGFWSAILGILKQIWSAIKGLGTAIGKIATTILDGLATLFVPEDTDVITDSVDGMQTSFDGKFPFSLAEEMSTLGTGISGGCPDWRVKVGNDIDKNIVCDSSFTGAIRGARGFILAGMLALAFWPLMRGVFYASVPVLKPVPVGGK